MAPRILIVDDSEIFRDGLRNMIEAQPGWQVCGEAGDGLDLEAIQKTRQLTPDVVMDFSMPRMAGIEATCEILKEFPKVQVLLLSPYLNRELAEDARHVRIRATVAKIDTNWSLDGIEAVLCGQDFYAPTC